MAMAMQLFILVLLPAAFLLPPAARAGEIIGGREAQPHSRPYMAYLEILRGNKTYICGGFLVSENFVLTAAHCNGDEITVFLGAHNIESTREQSRQVIPARVKVPHPRYNKKTVNNDIMLLQLKDKAELNKNVGLISLPLVHERVLPRTKCRVAGWGRTRADSEETSDTLRVVRVVVMRDATCPRTPNGPYRHYHRSTMLCAGDPNKGKDSAQGDSGGPLVCRGKAQGIVSWGPPTPPGVYTRVSTFIPWIEETMKKLKP